MMFKPDKPKIESAELTGEAVFRPATESLLYPDTADSLWPEEVKNNPELKTQAIERQQLLSSLDSLFTSLPTATTEISAALETKLINEKELVLTYNQLTNFLETNKNHDRLILYLPFELLPNKSWQTNSTELNQAINKFSQTYLDKWQELLKIHDRRANFVDGDILPTTEQPQVNKAAHLAVILAQKGWLDTQHILNLIEDSNDQILKNSLADVIPVLADTNLLTPENLEYMTASDDDLLNNLAVIIKSDTQVKTKPETKIDLKNLNSEFSELDKKYSTNPQSTPTARAQWEKEVDQQKIIDKYATVMSLELSLPDINKFITEHQDPNSLLVAINCLRKLGEKTKTVNSDSQKTLEKLWATNVPNIKDAIEKTWSRWAALGLMDKKYLKRLEANIDFHDPEINELAKITKLIETDEQLSKFLYPASIIYGSKIKGYGESEADIDLAVFVKPGTSRGDDKNIKTLLSQTFTHEKIKGKILEFWLEENDNKLNVKDFPNFDPTLADNSLAYALFAGVWCGQKATVKELHQKLLTPYLYDSKNKSTWLKDIERGTLQYRLMHKGYARFHPEQGGLQTPHSNLIDSKSIFWDSGYRRLASKLFISQVFLPQLKS